MSGESEKTAIMLADTQSQSLHSVKYTCPLCHILGYQTSEVQKHTKASTSPDPRVSKLPKEYPDLGQNVTRNMEKYSTGTFL